MSRKTVLFLIGTCWLLSLAPSWQAQAQETAVPREQKKESAPAQKIAIREMRLTGPYQLSLPLMIDSLDMKAEAYVPEKALPVPPPTAQQLEAAQLLRAGADSLFRVKLPVLEKKQRAYLFLSTYLRAASFGKAKLKMASNLAYDVFLDGKKLFSASGKSFKEGKPSVDTKAFHLDPSSVLLSFRFRLNPQDSLPAQEIPLEFFASLEVENPTAEMAVSVKPERYPDIDFMVYGKSLSSVQLSPSGRYAKLYLSESVDKKRHTRCLLYKDGKLLSELFGKAMSASWMPKRDLLYFTENTPRGRCLFSLDPEKLQRRLLAERLPEGSFQMTPSEDLLVFYTTSKGPKYHKTLDRFSSPQDRMPGHREIALPALYRISEGVLRPIAFAARTVSVSSVRPDAQKMILSISRPTPTVRPFSENSYYELDPVTMQLDTLFKGETEISSLRYTSDPDYLLATGTPDAFSGVGRLLADGLLSNSYDTQLYLYQRSTAKAIPLSKKLDRSISTVRVAPQAFMAYFTAEVGDRKVLYSCNLKTGELQRVSQAEDYVKQFDISSDGKTLAYVGQSGMTSDRCYTVDSQRRGFREVLLYDLAAEKMKALSPGTMQDYDYKSPEGSIIQGRFYLPPHFDPQKKYPLLVYYYGGTSPVSRVFEGAYSLPMYASLGYVVYSMNPSGSTGYGQAFAARHVNAWGKQTAADIIGAVKQFCKDHPYVNSQKVGCMGASYGGFMTQYLQTQTDLFAAAVSHAGISAISSYWGEGYWGVGYSSVASADSYPWNNPQLYTEHSPLYLADKINTPLLLIHGLEDTNVPVGESWQMFNALRILGKPVEFIGVYGQDHHILDPQKKYEWTSAIMAFFAKYLQDDPSWWNHLFPANKVE